MLAASNQYNYFFPGKNFSRKNARSSLKVIAKWAQVYLPLDANLLQTYREGSNPPESVWVSVIEDMAFDRDVQVGAVVCGFISLANDSSHDERRPRRSLRALAKRLHKSCKAERRDGLVKVLGKILSEGAIVRRDLFAQVAGSGDLSKK